MPILNLPLIWPQGDVDVTSPTWIWRCIMQMRPQDGSLCLPSAMPTLSTREVKHENEAMKLLMKHVESRRLHSLH